MADAYSIRFGMPSQLLWVTPSFASFQLNESGDQVEVQCQAPPDGSITITRLGFRLSTIAGTMPTYKISLQGVDGTGRADGTIKGGASPASKQFDGTGLSAGNWYWITLDNAYATTPGEFFSVVISYVSGTINSSNAMTVSTTVAAAVSMGFPYYVTADATGPTVSRLTNLPVSGFGTAGKAYGSPLKGVVSQSITSTANPNEYGMKFTLPAGWANTHTIRGVQFLGAMAASNTIKMQLYQGGNAGDTTVLQDVTVDSDFVTSAGGTRVFQWWFDEATLSTLSFGSTYRLSFAPQSNINLTLYGLDVDAAADWDAWDMAQVFQWTSRNGGNWTDTPTRRMLFNLILADISAPTAGGILVHPGMHGGMRA